MGSENLAKEPVSTQQDEAILSVFREVGQVLAEARKEQNLTILQVATKIHIRQRYLKDLEEGDLTDLPGRVYIFGFIRTYARFLNLDGEELIRRLSNLPNLLDFESNQVPLLMPSEEEPNYTVLITSGVLILLMAIGGYVFLHPSSESSPSSETTISEKMKIQNFQEKQSLNDSPEETKEKASALELPAGLSLEDTQKTLESKASTSVPIVPLFKREVVEGAIAAPKRIILKAREPSWVEIRDGEGRIHFMKVLKAGEEYIVPDKPGTIINTGNAGGVDIFVGDTKLPPLGARGDVKRGIRADKLQ